KKATNTLPGEIWDIAYMGDLTIYKVKLDVGGFAKVSVLNRAVDGEDILTWEDRVVLQCAPSNALLLDA
ncbi:MAG: TOBE domain-containing protein, partial [Pseudomonadota bacterium]